MTQTTPVATPDIPDFAIEQVRLYDNDTATAFLSLRDRVHGPAAGQISDRVFFIVLEQVDDEWKIDAIATEILLVDAVPGEAAYIPALDLRDIGVQEQVPGATPQS